MDKSLQFTNVRAYTLAATRFGCIVIVSKPAATRFYYFFLLSLPIICLFFFVNCQTASLLLHSHVLPNGHGQPDRTFWHLPSSAWGGGERNNNNKRGSSQTVVAIRPFSSNSSLTLYIYVCRLQYTIMFVLSFSGCKPIFITWFRSCKHVTRRERYRPTVYLVHIRTRDLRFEHLYALMLGTSSERRRSQVYTITACTVLLVYETVDAVELKVCLLNWFL